MDDRDPQAIRHRRRTSIFAVLLSASAVSLAPAKRRRGAAPARRERESRRRPSTRRRSTGTKADPRAIEALTRAVCGLHEEVRLLRAVVDALLRRRTPRLLALRDPDVELGPDLRTAVIRKMQRAEAKRDRT